MIDKLDISKKQIVRILCWTGPFVFAIIFHLWLLQDEIQGMQFQFAYLITHIFIPLIAGWRIERSLFSKHRAIFKTIHFISITLLFMIAIILSLLLSPFEQVKHYEGKDAEQQYISKNNTRNLMPELSELGQYTEIEYFNIYQSALFFYWFTDHLICHYTPEEYVIQKTKLDEEYIFQTEAIVDRDAICEPAADINGYHFRLLSVKEYTDFKNYDYPKKFILIGFSDEAKEIVYIAYDDTDLDYITSLENFIIDNCGFEYVR